MVLVRRGKGSGITPAALPFHILSNTLLQPNGASPSGFLPDETMRQLVLQDARQLIGHGGQALDRHAYAAIVERSRPTWRARDVHERLIGVQDHADGLGRNVVESRGDL